MIYGSVCSGIEAATQAWHPSGWRPAFFSEIEPFPSRVLAHHYPETPNLGDMTQFANWPNYAIDLLVGGTPCQSFSIAGLRKGLADPRGNLMLTFGAIAARYRPRWLLWENVYGVLSSNEGRDFASLLGLLSGQSVAVPEGGWQNAGIVAGYRNAYGLAWRVLDTQFVRTHRFPGAAPQRRRRVFLVGYSGDWHRAAAVLFDRESLSGNPPPRREAGQGVAGTISARTKGGGGLGTDFELAGGLICAGTGQAGTEILRDLCPTLNCNHEQPYIAQPAAPALTGNPYGDNESREGLLVAHTLKGEGFDASEDGTGRGTPLVCVHGTQDPCTSTDTAFALGRNSGQENAVFSRMAVRRLTPVECERLQAFPDRFTDIPKAKDGPRYKAIGNSMSVNAMEWIGERIAMVEAL